MIILLLSICTKFCYGIQAIDKGRIIYFVVCIVQYLYYILWIASEDILWCMEIYHVLYVSKFPRMQ